MTPTVDSLMRQFYNEMFVEYLQAMKKVEYGGNANQKQFDRITIVIGKYLYINDAMYHNHNA